MIRVFLFADGLSWSEPSFNNHISPQTLSSGSALRHSAAMTQILFFHSAGAQGPGEGSSRLLEALRAALPQGWTLDAPLMPEPDSPDASRWCEAAWEAMTAIEGPYVIVGHSLGGSTALQALALHGLPTNLLGVVTLASPFWGAPNWTYESFALPPDAAARLSGVALILLQGEADDVVARDHPDRYRGVVPEADIRRLPDVDHEAANAAPNVLSAVLSITPT